MQEARGVWRSIYMTSHEDDPDQMGVNHRFSLKLWFIASVSREIRMGFQQVVKSRSHIQTRSTKKFLRENRSASANMSAEEGQTHWQIRVGRGNYRQPLNMSSLAEISQLAQKDKAPAYVTLISNELSASPSSPRGIESIVNAVLAETPVVARQVLAELAKLLQDRASALGDSLQDILRAVLAIVAPRGVTFDEQVWLSSPRVPIDHSPLSIRQANALRNQLADLLEAEEDWKGAADVLIKLNMDASYSYAPRIASISSMPHRALSTSSTQRRRQIASLHPDCPFTSRGRRGWARRNLLWTSREPHLFHHRQDPPTTIQAMPSPARGLYAQICRCRYEVS